MVLSQGQVPNKFLLTHLYVRALIPFSGFLFPTSAITRLSKEAWLVCEGLVSAAQPHSKDNSAVGWKPSHLLAPSGGDNPCSWCSWLVEGLGMGNKGKKKRGNIHLEN